MSFDSMLNKSGTLTSVSFKASDYGVVPIKSDVYTSVPCALQPASGAEQVRLYGAEKVESTHILYLPTSFSIDESWEVTIDSLTYDILFVSDDAGRGHHQRIPVRIVEDL